MPSTVSVTVTCSDTADTACSSRKGRLCERCNRVTVYVNEHCRRCREEIYRRNTEMANLCTVCKKREVKGSYPRCYPCHLKLRSEKTKPCACGVMIEPKYLRCYDCNEKKHRRDPGAGAPQEPSFPFVIEVNHDE